MRDDKPTYLEDQDNEIACFHNSASFPKTLACLIDVSSCLMKNFLCFVVILKTFILYLVLLLISIEFMTVIFDLCIFRIVMILCFFQRICLFSETSSIFHIVSVVVSLLGKYCHKGTMVPKILV